MSGPDAAPPADLPPDELDVVTELLGRPPAGRFAVLVRRPDGTPAVIENAPVLDDGTPMPTRWWLCDPALRLAVSRLEAQGGVRLAEAQVDPAALEDAHRRYGGARDSALPASHAGLRPQGGVGGSRAGVKCLHAHLAWWLAGGDDPVGDWVASRLSIARPVGGILAWQMPTPGRADGLGPRCGGS